MLAELFRVILAPYAESGVLWKIGGCDGAAAWLPPGVAGRFAEIEQSTRAAISPLTGDGGARYAAFWDWLDAHLPAEPCWFLDLVGVAPALTGSFSCFSFASEPPRVLRPPSPVIWLPISPSIS